MAASTLTDCLRCQVEPRRYLLSQPATATVASPTGTQHAVHAQCKRDVETSINFFAKATSEGGVWRWESNGKVPFADMTGTWMALGLISENDHESSQAVRRREEEASIREYVRQQASLTPEQEAEQRADLLAAFGPGQNIVNALTGKVTVL